MGWRESAGGMRAIWVVLPLVCAWGAFMPAPLAAQAASKVPVTFSKDIAPILQRSCQQCHRPDSVAPMSLLTYEEARPYAREIKRRTALARSQYGRGAMPPWFYEKNIGIQKLKDDISLSDGEIAIFAAWADAGAPEGNRADLPPALTFASAETWTLGKPDLIVSSPTMDVKGVAPDYWGNPWTPTLIKGLTEDRYLSSVEYKEVSTSRKNKTAATVGGRFVFHHLTSAIEEGADASDPTVDPESGQGAAALPVHEVGRNGDVFPADAGRLVKAGSSIAWGNVHFHASGQPGDDRQARIDLGLRLHPKGYTPTFVFQAIGFGRSEIVADANEGNQKTDAYWVASGPIKLVNFEPHLHASGVRMCLEAIYARSIETLSCTGYDHNWVRNYYYDDNAAPLLPKGTILHAIAWWDTTVKNSNIIEPRNTTTWDRRSVGNMFIVFEQAIALTEEQYKTELAKRRDYLQSSGDQIIGCPGCFQATTPRAVATR